MSDTPTPRRDPLEFIKSRLLIRHKALWRIVGMVAPFKYKVLAANVLLFLASFISSFVIVSMKPFFDQTFASAKSVIHSEADAENGTAGTGQPAEGEAGDGPGDETETGERMRKFEAFLDRHPTLKKIADGIRGPYGRFNAWAQENFTLYILCFTLFVLVAMGVAGVMQFTGDIMMEKVGITVTSNLLRKLYANVLDQDLAFFDSHTTGSLLNTCYRQVFLIRPTIKLLVSTRPLLPLKMLVLFIAAMIISLKMSILLLMLLPVVIVPTLLLTSRLKKSLKMELEGEALPLDIMTEAFHGIRAVKAFGAEELEKEYMDPAVDQYVAMTKKRRTAEAIIGPVVDLLNMFVVLAVFALAFVFFGNDLRPNIGTLVAFMIILNRFYKPFRSLMTMNIQIARVNAIAERVFALLDHKASIVEKPDMVDFPENWDFLLLRRLNFSYSTRRGKKRKTHQVLDNAFQRIKRGEMIAIVGPNGIGKSSVTNLICRLYDLTDGKILVGDVPLHQIKLSQIREKICLITQQPILFNRSVAENISFGLQNVSRERIIEAARSTNCHDFISQLPDGYDTVVGEGGKLLSGGERQKVTLARAFVRNPDILIFDEPTAGLDPDSSAEFLNLMTDMKERGITIFYITHNMSELKIFDRVLTITAKKKIRELPLDKVDGLWLK